MLRLAATVDGPETVGLEHADACFADEGCLIARRIPFRYLFSRCTARAGVVGIPWSDRKRPAVPASLETNHEFLAAARAGSGQYRSCVWIEEGAFITKETVNMCCMQLVGSAAPVLFPVDDKPPSPDCIIAARNQLRIANQTDKAPCAGCPELREGEWQAKDYMGFIAIGGFLHCNLACSYCINYQFDPQDRGGKVVELVPEWIPQPILPPRIPTPRAACQPT